MMRNENNLKSKVLSGFFWKFGERITAQLISLIVSVILARLLSPSDYGAVALVMIFITFANVFVSSGLGTALVQKEGADNLDFSSVFYINIVMSVVLYIIIFLTAPFISDFYNLPVMSPVLRVLGLRIIVAAVNSVQHAYVSREMLFKKFFWSTLFGTLLSGIVGVFMAYCGFGVWALVAQYLTNTCTDTIVLWFTVPWRPEWKCSLKRAKGLISFGWKLLISSLLDTGYNQLRSLIIGKLYTSEALAFYNQGDKYPSIIMTNINTSIGSVIFPVMAQYQNDPEKVKQMTRRAIQISSYTMWPLMLGLGVVAEPVVRIVLTDKWLPCVPYLRIFCFTYGLWPIHTANLQALNAMGRSDWFLKLEIIKKVIGLVILGVSIQFGPFAIACSLVVSGIISIFINAAPNIKLLHYRYTEQLNDLFPSFLLSIVMAIIIYPICFLNLPDIVILLLQIVAGSVLYLILSIVTRQQSFFFLCDFLKTKFASKY